MIEFSVKRPIASLMFLMILIFLGMLSFFSIPLDTLPKIEYPVLTVSASYPNAGPEQVEAGVTKVLESSFTLLENVDGITSYSQEGSASVRIQYNWGVDLDKAIFDVREKIDVVRDELPEDLDYVRILKFSNDDDPILGLMVVGIDDQAMAFEFADDYLRQNLESVPGVGEINVSGGIDQEIRVELSQNRLQAFGLNAEDVSAVIRANDINISGGYVLQGAYRFGVRSDAQLRTLTDIKRIIISYREGTPIFLSDVATVDYGASDRNGVTYVNTPDMKKSPDNTLGKPAVLIEVVKTSEANTVEVIDAVTKKIKEISQKVPPNVQILEMYNNAITIKNSVKGLVDSGIQGLSIALLILFFYLWNFRSLLIIGLSIPISIIISFISMHFFEVTFNTVSLAGLTLAIGMVVDSSIVVLENIFFYKKTHGRYESSIQGAKEVALAISASTLTTIAVFVPILFLEGILAQMFRDLVITVVSGLMASLLVALTLVPMLASLITPNYIPKRTDLWSEKLLSTFDDNYLKILKNSLDHRKKIVVISLLFVTLSSALLYNVISKENQPESDEGFIAITLNFPLGTRYEENYRFSKAITEDINEYLGENLQSLNLRVRMNWRAAVYDHRSRIRIKLIPSTERDQSIQEIAEGLREILAYYPVKYWLYSGGRGSRGESIQIELQGNNLENSQKVASEIVDVLKTMKNLRNPRNTSDDEVVEVALVPNRLALAHEGITPRELSRLINISLGGRGVATIMDGAGNDVDIRVRIKEDDRRFISTLQTFQIHYNGKDIPLQSLVDIGYKNAPRGIERSDFIRIVELRASLIGDYAKNVVGAVDEIVSNVTQNVFMPPGVLMVFKGDYQDAKDNLLALFMAIVLSMFVVYGLMSALFESYIAPFVIMFSVPFGLFGSLFTLYITGHSLNIFSTVGMVVLVGIVINNGIVLVDYINQLIEKNVPLRDAIEQAGFRRLRPVCMTTFTTILGTLPVALGLGEGSERYAPFAVSIIGGLTISTFFTLIIIPLLYYSIRIRYPYRVSRKES